MMYNNKLVASIKCNGKILREFKDSVYIPFGSEYSILLKNLNTVRALVNIYIDGKNVVPQGLVLYAGQEVNLERDICSGNLSVGNKFKFIERTDSVEQYRGIGVEDGIVRIEYQFEKIPTYYNPITKRLGGQYNPNPWIQPNAAQPYLWGSGITCSGSASIQASSASIQNDAGITVPGSKSDQQFTTVSSFDVESEKHSIVLKLLGHTSNEKIVVPVTTKVKNKCTTCGKLNKMSSKYCSNCGTALELYK